MPSSNEGTSQGVSSGDGHPNSEDEVVSLPDGGYFSSSPPESPQRSPFSILEKELSLGIFFLPEDGEANDVLAALRASQKVVKDTREVVMGLRPRTEQVKEFAEMLSTHERDFMTWIFDGVGILPTTRIAIRSLPMFARLVTYINLLKDLQSDLPYVPLSYSTPPATRGSFLHRLSSATPSQSRTNSNSILAPPPHLSMGSEKDPRLSVVINKVVKSFAPLKDAITIFAEEKRKQRAYGDVMERTRKELGIPHDLCLQSTRQNIRSFIKTWVDSDPSRSPSNDSTLASPVLPQQGISDVNPKLTPEEVPSTPQSNKRVLIILGPSGSGKSALAATLACEWKRSGSLGAYFFIPTHRTANAKRSSTGKEPSGGGAEVDKPKADSGLARSHSLSRALSRIAYRRGSTSSVRVKTKAGGLDAFLETLSVPSTPEVTGKKGLVIVDGLDHASEEDSKRVLEAVKGAVERDIGLKVVLTAQREDLDNLNGLKETELVEFVELDRGAISLTSSGEGKRQSGEGHGDADDIRRYVASRLAVLLLPLDQERVVEAVQGSFADAVRVCGDIEETAAPERSLDGVLYREAVRKYGMEHVKVILV